jgi:hypothetical protein
MTGKRADLAAEADGYIKSNPDFAKAGIADFEAYDAIRYSERTPEQDKLIWGIMLSGRGGSVGWKLQVLDRIEECYLEGPGYIESNIPRNPDRATRDALGKLMDEKQYLNIMSGEAASNAQSYLLYLAILVVLAVLILIAPPIVTDRTTDVHCLQYASRRGRHVLKSQLLASLISAFLLTTALLVVFGLIYSTNGTFALWDNGLNSFMTLDGTGVYFFEMTYGGSIILSVILIYGLSLSAAAAGVLLSRFSRNIITLLFKLIPAFAVLAAFAYALITSPFISWNLLYRLTPISGIAFLACGALTAACLAAALYVTRRENRIDVI